MSKSRFDSALDAHKRASAKKDTADKVQVKEAVESSPSKQVKARIKLADVVETPAASPERRRRGRPAGGRRSSSDYVPITGYIQKDLYFDVDIALAQEAKTRGERREYSELIEELLARWVESRR